jgi:hypothetical protein
MRAVEKYRDAAISHALYVHSTELSCSIQLNDGRPISTTPSLQMPTPDRVYTKIDTVKKESQCSSEIATAVGKETRRNIGN